jgi:hypothetical protein
MMGVLLRAHGNFGYDGSVSDPKGVWIRMKEGDGWARKDFEDIDVITGVRWKSKRWRPHGKKMWVRKVWVTKPQDVKKVLRLLEFMVIKKKHLRETIAAANIIIRRRGRYTGQL